MAANKNNEEIDLKDIFKAFSRYKWFIFFIIILSTAIATMYAYYKPSIYESKSTIQIGISPKSGRVNDILQEALKGNAGSDNISTQIQIIKSRLIVLTAMQEVDIANHVWGVNKLYKSYELYLNSPISVDIKKGKNIAFKLMPIDSKSFILEAKKLKFKHIYKFGQKIKNKNFELIVNLNTKENLHKYKFYKFIQYKTTSYVENIINKHLKVSRVTPQANLIRISYSDTIPERAKDFLNKLVQVYMKQNVNLKTQEATKTLDFITNQLNIIKKKLKNSEHKIEEFENNQSTIDITSSLQQVSQKITDYQNKISILNMQISILKNNLKKLKRGRLDTLTFIGIDLNTDSISKLVSELQQAILDKKSLLEEYTTSHPLVKKVNSRIISLKTVIQESIKNAQKSLIQKRNLLKQNIAKNELQLKKVPKIQQDYLVLKRNLEFNNKFYKYLLEKKTETEIKKAATVNQNRIIEYASLPITPKAPNKKVMIIMGFIIGAFIGILISFIRYLMDTTIKSSNDIKKLTSLPITANIPTFTNKTENSSLITLDKPKSAVTESFRSLRTNLQFLNKKNNVKVITLTSTIADEGKSTIAANLATILQMAGHKVILVDFDLRKPTIHKFFNMPNGSGLSSYLAGNLGLDKIIKHTSIDILDIITVGSIPDSPSELVNSKKTDELIERLSKHYDYIIIDTPPVGLISDAKIILAQSDIVLYVVRIGYSKKEFLETLNTLEEYEINNIKIVINDDKKRVNYKFSYGYYGDE